MTEFELQIYGIRNNYSTNCAATTARFIEKSISQVHCKSPTRSTADRGSLTYYQNVVAN